MKKFCALKWFRGSELKSRAFCIDALPYNDKTVPDIFYQSPVSVKQSLVSVTQSAVSVLQSRIAVKHSRYLFYYSPRYLLNSPWYLLHSPRYLTTSPWYEYLLNSHICLSRYLFCNYRQLLNIPGICFTVPGIC